MKIIIPAKQLTSRDFSTDIVVDNVFDKVEVTQYIVNKNGYIDIEYRFGKLLLFVIPFIICFTAGIALWTTLVYDAIAFDNVQWGGLCVTALFWIFGLVGMLFRSRKERVLLEKHLLRICSIKS